MDQVYISNFGQANSLWPQAKANSTIATFDDVDIHDFWRSDDREGYIASAMENTLTALGLVPTKQTAGRWFNLACEMRDTEGDLWISRQKADLWWAYSRSDQLVETLQPSDRPDRNGPNVWVLEKPITEWSNRDRQGRPLKWMALHPKARDFLATESTFQRLSSDERDYAGYAKALINGESLESWHNLKIFTDKLAQAKSVGGKIYSAKERAAFRLARTMIGTVESANGQTVIRNTKIKNTNLTQAECELLIRCMFDEQEGRCALTGLEMQLDGEEDDKQMLVSLDRKDSSAHYTPDNIQLVCRFANFWKNTQSDDEFRRLILIVKGGHF